MKKYNVRAVVLKSLKYRDSDKIFTLLSKEKGKISAIGRGVRKISSRRNGNLDTLNLISVNIHEDRIGFKSIEEVKTIESFKNLKKDFERSLKAYYLIELVHKSIEEGEPVSDVFNLLVKCLKALDKNNYSGDLYISYFEINFMKLLGYQMGFDKCRVCNKKLDDSWENYYFNIENGSIECNDCSKIGINITKKAALSLNRISGGKLENGDQKIFEEIDRILKMYIGRKLENKFKSLEIDLD